MTAFLIIYASSLAFVFASVMGAKSLLPARGVRRGDARPFALFQIIGQTVALISNIAFLGICYLVARDLWPQPMNMRIGLSVVVGAATLMSVANLFKCVKSIVFAKREARMLVA